MATSVNTTSSAAAAAASATSSSGSATKNSIAGLAKDFDSFLKLFLTQLQNQDPTEPLDTNQMTDQIVQFSQVEQQINTNTKLDGISKSVQGSALNAALPYVDKIIEYKGDKFNLAGGYSEFSYATASKAESVVVTIKNEQGQVVRTVGGLDGTSGKKNKLVWDGTSDSGAKLADGVYTYSVAAKDGDDKDITVRTTTTGYVTQVDVEDGEAIFNLGDIKISLDDILGIKAESIYTNNSTDSEGSDSASNSADDETTGQS